MVIQEGKTYVSKVSWVEVTHLSWFWDTSTFEDPCLLSFILVFPAEGAVFTFLCPFLPPMDVLLHEFVPFFLNLFVCLGFAYLKATSFPIWTQVEKNPLCLFVLMGGCHFSYGESNE